MLMRRLITILAIATIASVSMSAQNFTEGSSQFKAQVGLLSSYSYVKIPPVSVSYDYCVVDFGDAGSIGVGGILDFMSEGYNSISVTDLAFGAIGTYHFTIPSVQELELYSGLMIYYNTVMVNTEYSFLDYAFNTSGFGYGAFIGAQYFFNDKMGASLQFGGMATMSAGIVFKL